MTARAPVCRRSSASTAGIPGRVRSASGQSYTRGVVCENRRGSLVAHARGFDGLQRRVVIVEGMWPNLVFEEGIAINLLTNADPGVPRGGAAFHDTSVWLSPA